MNGTSHDETPLTPLALEILLAVSGGEMHGYAILRDIEERTRGRVRAHPGTLYRAIARMVDGGLLEELEERPAPELDDERRRYYGLTARGRRAAEGEIRRLVGQVAAARERGLVDGPIVP